METATTPDAARSVAPGTLHERCGEASLEDAVESHTRKLVEVISRGGARELPGSAEAGGAALPPTASDIEAILSHAFEPGLFLGDERHGLRSAARHVNRWIAAGWFLQAAAAAALTRRLPVAVGLTTIVASVACIASTVATVRRIAAALVRDTSAAASMRDVVFPPALYSRVTPVPHPAMRAAGMMRYWCELPLWPWRLLRARRHRVNALLPFERH